MKKSAVFNKKTISGRLLICFLTSTLIPTILITAILCAQFSYRFQCTASDQMQVSLSLITDSITSCCNEIDVITNSPYYHSYFFSRKPLDPDSPQYLTDLLSFQDEMQNLLNLTTSSRSDITDLIIWSDGRLLYSRPLFHELWFNTDKLSVTEQPWYIHAQEENGKTVFTPLLSPSDTEPSSEIDLSSFFVTRKIHNRKQPQQDNLIMLNLTSRHFDSRLKGLSLMYDSFVVITNEKQEAIYSSKNLTRGTLSLIQNESRFSDHSGHWINLSSDLDNFPLTIHLIYSLDDLIRHIFFLILTAAIIYLLGLSTAFLLYRYYNQWIYHSAQTLRSTLLQLENGDLSVHCPRVDVNEFNDIGNSVNRMTDRLNEQIKKEYLMTIQQKSIELHALQSQIQPHFLINTITCLIALNQIGEKETLNSACYSLAHMMRYILNKKNYVTIEQELSFLDDYLKLQKLRFGARLSYQIDCPSECRLLAIPHLLLQPLTENALIHGIEPCEHPCFCRIRIMQQEDFLVLSVEDNGVGFHPDEKKTGNSVGLHYVTERLKLWSDRTSLTICCEEITCIQIKIPWEVACNESADC
ncbi:MAG: histidine kinase [Clostridiales bacterium]|nr:histidine kinase [Clostridiales bacterium]